MGMDELTLTYNAEKMELTISPISASRLHNITEVVRCEECKHWILEERCSYLASYPDEPYMNADDFCSYGERKDNERQN